MFSCASKKDMVYFQDLDKYPKTKTKVWNKKHTIQKNDILQIRVSSSNKEAATVYNKLVSNNLTTDLAINLNGYLVSNEYEINLPVLGIINVKGISIDDLEQQIESVLVSENHLIDASVEVRYLNSKFTVLGEVSNPGTFSFYDKEINVLQALGYAGDLTEFAKRKKITIIRENDGVRTTKTLDLRSTDMLDSPYYIIRNNDVIIVNPTFNRIKSSGFIGSPQSIASISSLLLTITLLIINN